jgi:hypothetical protein
MRENRLYSSEGGKGSSPSRPLSIQLFQSFPNSRAQAARRAHAESE